MTGKYIIYDIASVFVVDFPGVIFISFHFSLKWYRNIMKPYKSRSKYCNWHRFRKLITNCSTVTSWHGNIFRINGLTKVCYIASVVNGARPVNKRSNAGDFRRHDVHMKSLWCFPQMLGRFNFRQKYSTVTVISKQLSFVNRYRLRLAHDC